ncbi:hypothetical protein L6164_023693 [Bauhinia variegata]|uniref:Uncharacterized protein n=1 Tax=Bauhinia variegata TaxID=167791 RepID=A0ACB9MKF1_BAUVA|nr:hypothetical protein L6164_023693 [Bauhinia variegata]
MVVVEAIHFSSSKDKKPILASINCYGLIEEIWEVDYTKFSVFVLNCKKMNASDEKDETYLDIYKIHSLSSGLPELNEDDEVDDVHATRDDHHEGIWENIST